MRGVFNKLATLVYGERSVYGPPLSVYAIDVPCRVVPQNEIQQQQFPFSLSAHWLTLDQGAPNGPLVSSPWPGATYTDYKAADLVVVENPAATVYACVRREYVTPFDSDPYWRVLLIPATSLETPPWLPLVPPPPAPPPGPPPPATPTCEGAPVVVLGDLYLGTTSPVDSLWRKSSSLPAGTYAISYAMEDAGPVLQVYVGSCDALFYIVGLSGVGCYELVLPFDYTVYFEMLPNVDEWPYEYSISEGGCPVLLSARAPEAALEEARRRAA